MHLPTYYLPLRPIRGLPMLAWKVWLGSRFHGHAA